MVDRSRLALELSPLAQRAQRCLWPLAALTCLTVVVAVATSFVFQDPARDRLAAALARYQEVREAERLQRVSRQTQEALRDLWTLLPMRKDFADVVLQVAEFARHEEVAIPGMTYAIKKADEDFIVTAEIKFRSIGDYAAIRTFLHRLETIGPYLVLESLDATRSSSAEARLRTNGPVPVVFNVRLLVLLRADPKEAKNRA